MTTIRSRPHWLPGLWTRLPLPGLFDDDEDVGAAGRWSFAIVTIDSSGREMLPAVARIAFEGRVSATSTTAGPRHGSGWPVRLVRFVVDAQLPRRLARHFVSLGHDAVHVASLAGGERQPDADIAAYADADGRAVVTKDADFRHSHTVSGTPRQLLLVAIGNIRNDDLAFAP